MKLFTNHILLKESEDGFKMPSMEEIDNNQNMVTLYRVAFSDQLDSIFKYGYNRAFTGTKGGNMYGPGVYCTFNLQDSINNVKTKPEYGNCIVQMKLIGGFNGFIIFDENLAKRTYGYNWRIKDQLVNVAKFDPRQAQDIEQRCSRTSELYHGRTAPAAYYIWSEFRHNLFKNHGVKGLIYKGNRDGHCALPYDFSAVIPYAVSFDQGRTFKRKFNKDLYDFIKDHADVEFRFGGAYEEVLTSVRGFTMVKNRQGKYNVINNETNKPISDKWFDEIIGQINANTGIFGFTYNGINFYGSIYSPEEGVVGCILDPFDKEPFCYFSDLNDLTNDIKSKGYRNFEDYYEAEEGEGEEQNESKENIKQVIEDFVRNNLDLFLYEDRTVSSDGVVTIDNFDDAKRLLLKPETNDDVWFVQIIKRHKDNPTQHFRRNACEYISSYLIHNADELESKRNEIIAVCNSTNSRAYMHPNKRSLVSISDYANNVLKPRFQRHKNYDFMGHEMDIAAGQAKDWPDRKLCFLDIDSDDERVYNKVMDILKQHNIEPMWEYRSMNNGWHILLPDKEQVRNIDFSVIDNGYNYGRFATVGFEIDKPILLYASLKPNGYALQQKVQNHKRHKINRK